MQVNKNKKRQQQHSYSLQNARITPCSGKGYLDLITKETCRPESLSSALSGNAILPCKACNLKKPLQHTVRAQALLTQFWKPIH